MKYILVICFFINFYMSSFGSEDKEKEFILAVSNAANIVGNDVPNRYREICNDLRQTISSLEAQYTCIQAEYGYDQMLPSKHSSGGNEHLSNADELEKIRRVLDHKLREMILIERLKWLDEQYSLLENEQGNIPEACFDINDFINKLAMADEIKFKERVASKFVDKVIILNKANRKVIINALSSVDLEYDPKGSILPFEAWAPDALPSEMGLIIQEIWICKEAELVIDDRYNIRILPDSIICRAKTYRFNKNEEGIDLIEVLKNELLSTKLSKEKGGIAPKQEKGSARTL